MLVCQAQKGLNARPLTGQHAGAQMRIPYNAPCHAGSSSGSCFCSKLIMQQQIINTQRTAVPQCFTDIWFCLQSEAMNLNLGMEQEVRFQNSKINPLAGYNETRISSLWYSLKADGSMESVLLSKSHCSCPHCNLFSLSLKQTLKTCWINWSLKVPAYFCFQKKPSATSSGLRD